MFARAASPVSAPVVPVGFSAIGLISTNDKLSTDVVREEAEKTPMARKVHAAFTKFQTLVGPWDNVAEGAFHQFVAS